MTSVRQDSLLDSVLGAIGNTPLVELSRITRGLEGRILAKLEYLSPDLWLWHHGAGTDVLK